jgi:D-beta-D-heptose 7-phosphate kinase/D-beta-D-heptose 1-phosphate adenosyltransferase
MSRLTTLIDRFASTKILCIGDIMLDEFLYGVVNRISPEAPVPIMKMNGVSRMLGGAGNVVSNLRSLGCPTTFIGVVGRDTEGEEIRRYLEETGCQSELIVKDDYETTIKIRFVAGKHHLLRADKEQELLMDKELTLQLLDRIDKFLPESNIVLLSDYGKGIFDAQTTQAVINRCRALGKPVIVDPKGSDYSRYRGATLIKPNIKEFTEATGIGLDFSSTDWPKHVQQGARQLFNQFGIEQLLVTLSEHGMIFINATQENQWVQIPTEAKEVFDVSGAGDTSLACLGASLAAGAQIPEALQLSNTAAGIVVGKFGTACVTPDELKLALGKKESICTWKRRDNVLSVSQLLPIIHQAQAHGKKVGFTNGCFDLLHLGHLQSFIKTRELCDLLIVGINTDASVKRLKGEHRPINSEEMRSLLVSSLEYVDYVVLFDDDTALPLLEKLRPDIIAKEGYPLDRWPEGQFVVSYGGQAVELPRLDGFSSTDLIKRINSAES